MIKKAIKLIKNSHNILILTHESPDGDALGSMLALYMALTKEGKKISCICASDIPNTFSFLPKSHVIKKDFLLGDYDAIIILDCGDSRRTGYHERIKEFTKFKNKIINIDHHAKNDLHKIASLNIIDYQASSTSEIVYFLLQSIKINIDKEIALCLLCGLYTDTCSFKHSNTTTRTLKIASNLLRKGARLKKITENVINNHSLAALRLRGIALKRLKFNQKYKIATSFITSEDMQSCQAACEDASGIVNMINAIPGVKIALFLYQLNDKIIKGSLRTEKNNINLARFAKLLGGGGLKKASGFKINGQLTIQKDEFCIKYL